MTAEWWALVLIQAAPGGEAAEAAEPGMQAVRIAAFGLCALALGVVGYYTLVRRGAVDTAGRWLLMAAFLVVSPLAYALNFGLAVNGSKPVAFCGSCHEMHGYIADLQDPDSEYLAAMHYQFRWVADHQCYTCHSDYGLFGNVEAKLAGLRHIWFHYTGGYEVPLRIRGTYDNQRCLFCHGPVKAYQEIPEHEKNAATIATSETSCLGGNCHVAPHPKAAARPESAHAS